MEMTPKIKQHFRSFDWETHRMTEEQLKDLGLTDAEIKALTGA